MRHGLLRARMTRRRGVTMVEVLVVFGIIGIFTTALFSLFVGSLKTYDTSSGKSFSDTNVSLALQKAAREIADGMSASVSSGQLIVQLPQVNSEGNYERTVAGNTVRLYRSGTSLYRQINSSTATVLAKDISAASFAASGGSVTITLTGQGRTGMRTMTTQMSQVVALRNYEMP
jgi:type II secretory pathway pseudopilin PulG